MSKKKKKKKHRSGSLTPKHTGVESKCFDAEKVDMNDKKKMLLAGSISFSGPLPHPSILEGYEKVHSGAADRIIQMAEDQSSHRKKMEEKIINSNVFDSRMGLVFGFLIALALIFGGVFLVYNNHSLGYTLTFGTPVGLVGLFIYNKRQKK